MNRKDFPRVSKSLRRTRLILFALLLLAPLALLTQSQYAQKNRVRREEKRTAEARKKSSKTKEEAGVDVDEAKRRLAASPKPFRQSGLSPEPISAQAAGFAVSRPLAEVAKQTSRQKVRAEILEEDEHEAAENHVTRVTTPQAQAAADEAAARGGTRGGGRSGSGRG